jgi:hypothetical protein
MSGLSGSNSINQSGIVGGDSCIGSIATTTTGLISGGSLDIDNVLINGTTIGHTCDTDLLTVGNATLLAKGTVTVGVCATGHDVKFFGDTAGAYMLYDQSEDHLEIRGAAADAATSTGKLLLSTALTNINANDVIGSINFQAPLEAGGTDAITVAAGIRAVAQATFTCAVNATDLIFYTGHSEAATEKFRFTSQGEIGIGGANYGSDGQVLTSGGAGAAAAWEAAGGGGDVVCDTSPQLGGAMDAQNNAISNIGAAGHNIHSTGITITGDGKGIFAQGATQPGVTGIGAFRNVTVGADQKMSFQTPDGALFVVQNGNVGYGALFFVQYTSATVEALAGSTGSFTLTSADEGKVNIYKSSNSGTTWLENRTATSYAFRILVLGGVATGTAVVCS